MKPRILLLAAVLFGAAFALAQAQYARAADPEVLADRWDVFKINGKAAGHLHTLVRRAGTAAAPLIETTVTTHTDMMRGPDRVITDEVSVTTERPDGALASMKITKSEAGKESAIDVLFADGKAVITTTEMGQRREASVPLPAGTVGPWRAERIPVEAGLKAGTQHQIPLYMNDLGGSVLASVTVGGSEEVETLDGKQRLVRLDLQLGPMPVMNTWVTPEGYTILTRVEMMGMKIEVLRGTQEQVLGGQAGKEGPPEVFAASLIKTPHLVPHARVADSALYAIKPKRAGVKLPSLEDERQKVEKREADGSLRLRVRRVVPAAGATGKRPLASPSAEIAPFLASSSMLQVDDPLIQQTAAEAIGPEVDAWKAAQVIEAWVHKAIEDKNLGVSFGSALQVCKDRKGDCTEHAVLTAALCRAVGIPARVVFGLEYLSGILGGHAWSEVWIEGHWYALDATLGTGSADALHLALGSLALTEGTYGKEFIASAMAMNDIDVEILEVGWPGKTLRLDRPDAIVAEEGRYLNRLWGLALDAPSGFKVKPREPFRGLSDRLVDFKSKSPERKLKVHAGSLLPGTTLDQAARMHARGATLKPSTIDGRAALVGTKGEGKERSRLAFVLDDGDSLFSFEFEPFEGEADEALFDALLKTVDLDAEDAGPATPK